MRGDDDGRHIYMADTFTLKLSYLMMADTFTLKLSYIQYTFRQYILLE